MINNISDPNEDMAIISNLNPGILYRVRLAGINTRGIGTFSMFSMAMTYTGKVAVNIENICWHVNIVK